MTQLTMALVATLVLLPLATEARPAKPRSAPTTADARATTPPREVDLSALQTTEYGSSARRPRWQASPTHTYDSRGVDCTLYPARCRR